jgi:hypothetical protein
MNTLFDRLDGRRYCVNGPIFGSLCMKKFPDLPILEQICSALVQSGYGNVCQGVVFVCAQHLLDSTGSLIQCLIRLGARPADIFIVGKRYSSNSGVLNGLKDLGVCVVDASCPPEWKEFGQTFDIDVRRMWHRVSASGVWKRAKKMLVIDDGGHCIHHVPNNLLARVKVSCVEQTTSGLRNLVDLRFPVINVASSAVKRHIEAPLVAATIIDKTMKSVPEFVRTDSVGILGCGSIGSALMKALVNDGKRVFAYDTDPSKVNADGSSVERCDSVQQVLQRADIVFGCTGQNLSVFRLLPKLTGRKILVSCSSEDREFHSFVRQYYLSKGHHFGEYEDDIVTSFGATQVRVVRGGFPVNFDHSAESVPNADIQVTRGLLLGAVVQALLCPGDSKLYNLNPLLQTFVLSSWLGSYPDKRSLFEQSLLKSLSSLVWIEGESGNAPHGCPSFWKVFGGAAKTSRPTSQEA